MTENEIANEIGLEVPPEPPNRSVVLDRDGLAWQRIGGLWVRSAVLGLFGTVVGPSATWADLLLKFGPVRVLHYASIEEAK